MKNTNRRSLSVAAHSPEDIHRPIRVGDFRVAEARVRCIERASHVPAGSNGNLIVESFRAAKVSLREARKNIFLHIIPVQRDHDPIRGVSRGILAAGGGGRIMRNGADERRDLRLELPASQGPARIEAVCKFGIRVQRCGGIRSPG